MNAMRPILLAALLALPLPLAAQTPTTDSFMSAAKLKELCFADTADNPVSSTFVCVGYIMGVVDTLASLKAWDQTECLFVLLAETERRGACQATRRRRCAGCRHR